MNAFSSSRMLSSESSALGIPALFSEYLFVYVDLTVY